MACVTPRHKLRVTRFSRHNHHDRISGIAYHTCVAAGVYSAGMPGDFRRNAMLNHLKWIAAAVLALGIVPAGSGQAARQPEGNDPVAQSLIEMERHWSESA